MSAIFKKYLFAVFFGLAMQITIAQQAETYYFYYKNEPNQGIAIDSSLNNLENYHFTHTKKWDYFNLGNSGQAHYKLCLPKPSKVGFTDGMIHFDRYKYFLNKVKYYQTKKPYSEIYYFIGSKGENIFGANFAQNIKNIFSFGFNFHRIYSVGVYENQRARNGNFSAYAKYTSKSDRFTIGYDMVFSKIKSEESGGVVEDFINEETLRQRNKKFYSTYLNSALTQHKNLAMELYTLIRIGKYISKSINDSLKVKTIVNPVDLSYTIGFEKNKYEFVDKNAPSLFYKAFYQDTDSTHYKLFYRSIPNKLTITYNGLKAIKDSIKYLNFKASIYVKSQFYWLQQYHSNYKFTNISIGSTFHSQEKANSPLSYIINTNFVLSGYNKNDWNVNGKFSYKLSESKILYANAGAYIQEPSFIENHYYSPQLNWENNFKKKNRIDASIGFKENKWDFDVQFNYSYLRNFIYFNEQAYPIQTSRNIHYWNASIYKGFKFKIMHFDNFIGFQTYTKNEALKMPVFFIKSSFYIQGSMFKGNLVGRLGVDVRYNTNFSAYSWQPLTGQFYVQNYQTIVYTPIVDFFFSFKVRTLRFFFKAAYLNEGLGRRNIYLANHYPSRGRTFAGGFIWRFFE